MNLWLFPETKREFAAKRTLSIVLRSLHLIGIAGLSGQFLFALQVSSWQFYGLLALLTGLLMVAIELYVDGIWLLQLRGQAIMIKLLVLALSLKFPQYGSYGFWLIILISGYFSHAPRTIRYYITHRGKMATSSAELRRLKLQ